MIINVLKLVLSFKESIFLKTFLELFSDPVTIARKIYLGLLILWSPTISFFCCFSSFWFHAVLVPCFLHISDPISGLRSLEIHRYAGLKFVHNGEKVSELDINSVSAQSASKWPRKTLSQNVKDDFYFKIFPSCRFLNTS